ncbi:molybdenum cofactor guanylyltransferase [uncultured Mailhella sp.]|uniref:molybdenum cofactor guanylyltransferase n=1 Tax=uncultured Mailhella sp. TaxID=1981031 RepID=UPI00263840B1|nr:molybdenum cofactor guanylyltransferase [uncultured Mailhella sp.]
MIGVILAGGQSSRFGSDKSHLLLPGRNITLLQHLLSVLSALPCLSGTAISCRSEQLPLLENFVSSRFVLDHTHGENGKPTPLRGLISTIETLDDATLVIPCDLPLMTTSTLALLANARSQRATPKTLRTAFVHDCGMMEPLVAIYEKEALPHLLDALRKQLLSLHDAIPPERQILVPSGDRSPFFNLNTPADLCALAGLS